MVNEYELSSPEKHLVLISRYFHLPAFVIVGIIFVAIPNGVLSFFNTITEAIGIFEKSNLSVERFWVALTGSYMVMVSAIAWYLAKDIRKNFELIKILIIGKAASSLLSLVFFIFYQNGLIYFANFVADGQIALTTLFYYKKILKDK